MMLFVICAFLLCCNTIGITSRRTNYDDFYRSSESAEWDTRSRPAHYWGTESTSNNYRLRRTSKVPKNESYAENVPILNAKVQDDVARKVVNAFGKFVVNYKHYQKIQLTLNDYSFPKEIVKIDLNKDESALFRNFTIWKSYDDSYYEWTRIHSMLIGCNASKPAKIQATLPPNIHIATDLYIVSKENKDVIFSHGSLEITLNRSVLSTELIDFSNRESLENKTLPKMIFNDSKVHLEIDGSFQEAVYDKLETFLNHVIPSLENYFVKQLIKEIHKNNISLADICSESFNSTDEPEEKNNFHSNHSYVITRTKLETWKAVTLETGPIIIDGLSNFINTEFVLTSFRKKMNYDYRNTGSKELIMRIKTGGLQGSVDWRYAIKTNFNRPNRSLVFPFFIDFIQFESKITNSYYEYDHYNREEYFPRTWSKVNVSVRVGEISAKTTQYNSAEEYNNPFVRTILAEFLKSVIAESLEGSIREVYEYWYRFFRSF